MANREDGVKIVTIISAFRELSLQDSGWFDLIDIDILTILFILLRG